MKISPRESRDRRISDPSPCACFNLRKAARAVTQAYEERLRGAGLTATQFTMLRVIQARGPISIGELANVLVTDQSTLTRSLRLLERDGLVLIKPGSDRRVREVTLRAAGRARVEDALPLWRQAQQEIGQKLGVGRLERLLDDLQATVNAVRD